MLRRVVLAILILYHGESLAGGQLFPAPSLASQYALTTSTSMPFPTATLSSNDSQNFIVSGWSLSKGRIQNGPQDLDFVQDPFPNAPVPGTSAPPGPVLQVTYPNGSFSHDTGGTQMYSLWNTTDGSQFNSMLLSYEVAFDDGFNWVKGGKLPGLRGGPDVDGCSGGDAANGTNCFSSRLMWRKDGEGEVYAYIPSSSTLCADSDFLCNQDGFGTSIQRGSFSFASGKWNLVTMLIRMNTGSDTNGEISLYYNNVKAIDQQTILIRSSDNVSIGGLYFSTFFGGNDPTWQTPQDTHTYFRNIQMWGSSAASNLSGKAPNSAVSITISVTTRWLLSISSAVGLACLSGIFTF